MLNNVLLLFIIIAIIIWVFWIFCLKNRIKISSYIEERIDSLIPILFLIFLGALSNANLELWAIIITVVVFLDSQSQTRLEYWKKQEDMLKLLYEETNYLLDKKEGHIKYFRECLIPMGYPHHNMTLLNINFYITELGHKINSQPTLELKNKLKKINDKINMLNDYRKDEKTWEKMFGHMQSRYGRYGYLKKILKEVGDRLEEIQKIINNKFKIKINVD